jgi:hypothetical protein
LTAFVLILSDVLFTILKEQVKCKPCWHDSNVRRAHLEPLRC